MKVIIITQMFKKSNYLLLFFLLSVLIICNCIEIYNSSCPNVKNPDLGDSSFPSLQEREFSVTSEPLINISLLNPKSGSKIRSESNITISFDPLPSIIQYRWDGTGNWITSPGINILNITSPLSEGNHYVTLEANNSENIWNDQSWAFKIDDHSIFFTLINPTEFSTHNSGTDIIIEMDPVPIGVLYSWDENPYSALLRSLPVGDGLHVLYVRAEDSESNWYSTSYSFYTDDTAPQISLSKPNNSLLTSLTKITWSNIPFDIDQVWYNWDNAPNESAPYNKDTFEYEFFIPKGSTYHNLTIFANDSINNLAVSVYHYRAKLQIGLLDHTYGVYVINQNSSYIYMYAQSNITIQFNYTETTNIVYYNWWLNSTHSGINETALNKTPMEGSKRLQIFAEDIAGYWFNLTIDVIIDDIKPIIISSHFENNSKLLKNTPIGFNYAEETISKVLFSWDNQENLTLPYLPIQIGKHELYLYLQDWALNWNSYYFVYYTKYNVTLINALNNSYLQGNYAIDIFIDPMPFDIKYKWDDALTTSILTPLPSNSAWHVLLVNSSDLDGVWYVEQYFFLTILEVNMTTPIEGKSWQSEPVQLTFSETPLTTLYSWDSESYSTFLHDTPTIDGIHWLNVSVENSNLPNTHWFYYRFQVIIDNSPCELKDVTPTNNSRVNNETILSLTVSENSTATYYWNSDYLGNTSVEVNDIDLIITMKISNSLTDGINKLILNFKDCANNTISYTLFFLIDNTPITICLNKCLNNTVIRPQTNLNITFSETPVIKLFFIESYSQENETSIPQIPYANTTITLHIYVSDGLNWNHTFYTFEVLHNLARFELLYPINGSTISQYTPMNTSIYGCYLNILYQWNDYENQTILQAPKEKTISPYNLTIWLEDVSGIWRVSRFIFFIDNIAPFVLNTVPQDSVVVGKNILFNCSETVTFIRYKWNIEENYSSKYIESCEFFLTAPFKSGNHTLELILEDQLGNHEVYQLIFMTKKTANQVFFDKLLTQIVPISIITISIGLISFISVKRWLIRRTYEQV